MANTKKAYEALKKRMSKMKEKAEEQTVFVRRALVTSATAGGLGFARGRFAKDGEELKVAGVPVTAGVAVVGHGVGFFLKEDVSNDLHTAADASLAIYLERKMAEAGKPKNKTSTGRSLPGRSRVMGGSRERQPAHS